MNHSKIIASGALRFDKIVYKYALPEVPTRTSDYSKLNTWEFSSLVMPDFSLQVGGLAIRE